MANDGKQCKSPPEYVITISTNDGEYMVGVTCARHRLAVSEKLTHLQSKGSVPKGMISFSVLKAVGTNCVKGSCDDLINL
ncbi:MAG: hypothetical protein K8823_1498 [Cenarchaeum symbiont of Oopsacas minuta]|nr:hypothetical protein [Cenarchaeum symbiont of Oopsacas minuta]